jgi:MFS family permease
VARPTSVLSRDLLPASIAIFVTVALAAFEGLAVAAALPEVAADLGSVALLPWVITSFLLTSGVATIVSGRLIDTIGVRTMFRIAVIVFAGAGVLAAFAPSMEVMIGLRAVQGVGSGMVIAVGLAAVSLIYPPHLTGRAFAANSTVWGVMGVASPAIAAVMLTQLDWRWIFLINLPLGLISLVAGWRVMPPEQHLSDRNPMDYIGTGLALLFTAGVLFAVNDLRWSSVLWLVAAAAAGYVFYRRSGSHQAPLVERRYLAETPFAPLAFAISLLITGAIAPNAFVPLYVSAGRLASEATTAWSVLFFTVGWTAGANLSSRLLDSRSQLTVIRYGFATTIPSLVLTAVAGALSLGLPVLFGALFGVGVGIGLATNASLTLLRDVSSPQEIGRSTAAHQFFRNQGFAFGSAIGGAALFAVVASIVGDPELVRDVLAGDAVTAGGQVSAAVVDGFALSAAIGAAIAALGLLALRHLSPAGKVPEFDNTGRKTRDD